MSKTSNRGGSLLALPIFDCSLQLIMIIFATAGLAWLRIWSTIHADEDPHRAMSRPEIERQILIASAKKETLDTALEQRRAEAKRLDRALQQARSRQPDGAVTETQLQSGVRQLEELLREREGLQRQLKQLTQRLSQLEQQQQDLEKKQSDLAQKERELEQNRRQIQQDKERLEQLKKQLAGLDRQLQDLNAANTQLREKIAAEQRKAQRAPTVSIEAQPRVQANSGLHEVFFVLHQGTVTPAQEPHYSVSRLGDGTELWTKVSAGETADQALAEGSAFLQALAKMDRKKQFAALLVDRASFETFRAVRDELRRRQILTGWEPSDFPNLRLVSASQGSATVIPQ